MKKGIVISILLLFIAGMTLAYAGESVTFKGTSKESDSFILRGILTKPQGQGPFPAIVMLSPGSGFREGHQKWMEQFVNWGYVALQVETLSSRGRSSMFDSSGFGFIVIGPRDAAQDAYDAKTYLLGLPFVDGNRIAVIGWALGGWAIISVIDPKKPFQNRGKPFKAAVALYPVCDQPLTGFDAPLLILHAELDTWHPVRLCKITEGPKGGHEIILKIYPGAYSPFDIEGKDLGAYDPIATADAIEQTKNFLAKHIK
jgi:dienelactone hydrolase